jgi:hypothetical protein
MRKYIASALFEEYGRPILAPKMITMDRWVKSHSQKTVIDTTRAMIELFKVQLESAETIEDHSFDEFMSWGKTLLADYNEIDRYMLDAKQIFRNLAEIKEIENWSFGREELTESQKRFMEFWDRLPGYYYALQKQLDKEGQCLSGKAYRDLAENIQLLFQEDEQHQYLFAGFNALSPSELSIIKQVDNYGRAHILVDADEFYYEKKTHEAGAFLRALSTGLADRKLDRIQQNLAKRELKVEMIDCVQNTGQVKVASTLLEEMTEEEVNETLLLLADESLITSLVRNLPSKIGKANITLGLPIRNTAIKTWVELLFSMQENKRRFKTNAIYFSDLQSIWNHPFVLAALDAEELELCQKAEADIIHRNRRFVNSSSLELGEQMRSIINLIEEVWSDNWSLACKNVRQLNQIIYKQLESTFDFEKAILQCFDEAMVEMENLVSEGLPEMSLNSFKLIFNQHWTQRSIAYHGNPLDGLQIMGMLETRGLDFKRIICLGMNEGNLPPTNPISTMIPMDLRRYHGLPTPREKQGIFAHHFYRLLHNCEEFYVTYSSASEAIGSNEPSRYLMQLEMELARANDDIKISKRVYTLNTPNEQVNKEIIKTPEVINRLDEVFASSTSASKLKKYLTCPLDFYFKYVMELGEADTVEEDVEHSTFGTFIHNTLEHLYTPFARFDADGNKCTPEPPAITSFDVEKMLKDYKLVLHKEFMKHFNNDEATFTTGKNLLSYKMAMELTERFLKSEIKFLSEQTQPVFIEALERKYETDIKLQIHGEEKTIKLYGIVDRIDSIGDKVRIIDYKSGQVKKDDVSLRAKDDSAEAIVESISKKKHVLQLMLYAFLYRENEDILAEPSIVSFISNKNVPFALNVNKHNTLSEITDKFPEFLEMILSDVYNTEVPFQHKSNGFISFCKYCE